MPARSPLADPSPLLRPALFVAVAAAHVAAFGFASWTAQPPIPAPRLSIEVTLASPPPAMEAAPAEEAALQEAPPETPVEEPAPEPSPEPPPEVAPEPLPEPIPEPAPPPAPESPPAPEPEPEPAPAEIVTAAPPPRPDDVAPFVAPPPRPVARKPAEVRKAEVRKPEVRKPEVQKPPRPKAPVAKPQPVRAAPQTAGSNSRAPASVASTTQYGAVISAAIRARTVFPPSAQGSGGGVVMVAFVIGPSGRAQSASVVGSSGNAALDRAALAAVRGVSAPPPPGGRYAATAPIRFSLQ